MERRVFIAVLLSFVVLYTYQTYFAPAPAKPPAAAAPAATGANPATASAPAAAEVAAEPSATSEPAPAAVLGETQAREITVETPTARIVFTNRGGRVLHWYLKTYQDSDRPSNVDLIPSELPEAEPRPFTLQAANAKDTARLNGALYRVSGDSNGVLDVAKANAPLVFEFQDESGLAARKEFRFEPKGYTLTATISARRGGSDLNPAIQWGPGLGDHGAAA